MADTLPQPASCCNSCDETLVENIPGPIGATGAAGADGNDGVNAFTETTDAFDQPAVSGNVTVDVADSTWMAVGQIVFIENGGYYEVVSKPSSTSSTLKNLGYAANVAQATNVASGNGVSPGGERGEDGTSASGDMLAANNLSDLANAATARGNLGGTTVGQAFYTLANPSAITFPRINANNTVTARASADLKTDLGLVIGTNVQAYDAELAAIAGLVSAADKLLYFTGSGTAALADLTSTGRALIDDASTTAMLVTLGRVLPRYGILGSSAAVNLNSALTDTGVTINATKFIIDKIMVEGASINLTTATASVYTGAGGTGTSLANDQVLSALTASTKFKNLTLEAVVGTDTLTSTTLYFRVGTAQGAAATANVWILGWSIG